MSYYSFSDRAIRDLDAICSYIAENNPRAASKLFDKICQKCKSVEIVNHYVDESAWGKGIIAFLDKVSEEG